MPANPRKGINSMKLNPDCIRSILLTAESKCTFTQVWEYSKSSCNIPYLAKFSHEEVLYHIRQASESSLIKGVHYYDGGTTVIVHDLTPAGHEFLANIRNQSVWTEILKKASDASLPILTALAKQLAIKTFLG